MQSFQRNNVRTSAILLLASLSLASCGGGGGGGGGGSSTSGPTLVYPSATHPTYKNYSAGGDTDYYVEVSASVGGPTLNQNFLGNIKAQEAYNFLTSQGKNVAGGGIVVGVVDDGIDKNHIEFAPALPDGAPRINPNSSPLVPSACDAGSGSNLCHGHMVTSLINASMGTENSNGVGMHGVAFNSQVYFFSTSDTTNNDFPPAEVKILNMSFTIGGDAGGYGQNTVVTIPDTDSFKSGIVEATKNGMIIVAAAGNDGRYLRPNGNPAVLVADTKVNPGYDNLVTALSKVKGLPTFGAPTQADRDLTKYGMLIDVVATDGNKNIAGWSSLCGGSAYNKYCLAAPGDDILVAVKNVSQNSNSSYAIGSGTSFSAPIVSGSLAVLMGAFPELAATPWKYGEILLQTADAKYYTSAHASVARVAEDGTSLPALTVEDPTSFTKSPSGRYYNYTGNPSAAAACAASDDNCDAMKAVLSYVYGWGNLDLENAVKPQGRQNVVSCAGASTTGGCSGISPRSFDLRTTSLTLPGFTGDLGNRIAAVAGQGVFTDKFGRLYQVDLASKIQTNSRSSSIANLILPAQYSRKNYNLQNLFAQASFGTNSDAQTLVSSYVPDLRFTVQNFGDPELNRASYSPNSGINNNLSFSEGRSQTQSILSDVSYHFSPKFLKQFGTSFDLGLNQSLNSVRTFEFAKSESVDSVVMTREANNPYLSFNQGSFHHSLAFNQSIGKQLALNLTYTKSGEDQLGQNSLALTRPQFLNNYASLTNSGINGPLLFNDKVRDKSYTLGLSYKLGSNPDSHDNVSFYTGRNEEQNSMMGAIGTEALNLGNLNKTSFFGVKSELTPFDGTFLLANLTYGVTKNNNQQDLGIVHSFSDIYSRSFKIAGGKKDFLSKDSRLGFAYSEPLRIVSGSAAVDITRRLNAAGDTAQETQRVTLTPSGRERNYEMFYSKNLGFDRDGLSNSSLSLNFIYIADLNSIKGLDAKMMIGKYIKRF